MQPTGVALGVALAALLSVSACSSDDERAGGDAPTSVAPVIDPGDGGDYHPEIDPGDFVARVDNPYFPLRPGASWVYEGRTAHGPEREVVRVTDRHREVLGIPATVVRDTVRSRGEVIEDTRDWYAQDRDGNVWYLGENTTEYDDGEPIGTEGSWEAGVDGAEPGIIMPAEPAVGDAYRQEYSPGVAEDMARVTEIDAGRGLPAGDYRNMVVTEEWSPLEPEIVEEKWYAPGVGPVAESTIAGGADRLLLRIYRPGD